MRPEDLPLAIDPVYSTASMNQRITLFRGRLGLEQGGHIVSGEGVIRLQWLPSLQISFEMKQPPANRSHPIDLEQAHLHIPYLKERVEVFIYQTEPFRHKVWGRTEPIEIGNGRDLSHMLFHLPNFPNYSAGLVRDRKSGSVITARHVIEAGGWRCTLDFRQTSRFMKRLARSGGFALTHVGRLQRCDSSTFSADDAQKCLDDLAWFLSFCAGGWVAPLVPVGFDRNGKKVWRQWNGDWRLGQFREFRSWYREPTSLDSAFSGLLHRRNDASLRNPLKLAMAIYLESLGYSGAREGSLILTQVAFEALRCALNTGDKFSSGKSTKKDRESDGEKLRGLLDYCEIPISISSSLQRLREIANRNDWVDGPMAVTRLRNWATHPAPKSLAMLFAMDTTALFEASQLSLWYLELILLKLSGYDGQYANRLIYQGWRGDEIDTVPWAKEASE